MQKQLIAITLSTCCAITPALAECDFHQVSGILP
jgi:hypothetical protein